ncbi:MAG: hypothetical protein WBM38_05140 [Arenicellales bacterium]|jgi:hypothetical protein
MVPVRLPRTSTGSDFFCIELIIVFALMASFSDVNFGRAGIVKAIATPANVGWTPDLSIIHQVVIRTII